MENISIEQESAPSSFVEKISYYILIVFVFLLPFFFLPSLGNLQQNKGILIGFAVLVPFILMLVRSVKRREVSFQKNWLFFTSVIFLVVLLISSLVNGHFSVSFIGKGFETGTFAFVALLVILMMLISQIIRTQDKVMRLYSTFWISITLLLVLHIGRLFFGTHFLAFNVLTNATANFVGKWTDLGILFGAAGLLSLITLEFLPIKKTLKWFLSIVMLLFALFLFIINFTTLWSALAVSAGILIAVKLLSNKHSQGGEEKRSWPVLSIIALIISVALIIPVGGGSTLGTILSEKAINYFNTSQVEIRPAWKSTFSIAGKTYDSGIVSLLLGSGQNRFVNQYLKFKPEGVNATPFWNYDFDTGVGYVPTFMVTAGILGVLSWLLFLVLFVYRGGKAIFQTYENRAQKYVVVSSFITAFFFWFMAVTYVPSAVTLALTFVFTGIAIAVFFMEGQMNEPITINLREKNKIVSLFYYIILILLIIGSLFTLYKYTAIIIANNYFQNAMTSLNQGGKVEDAEAMIKKAVQWNPSDIYYQVLAELNIVKMSQFIAANKLSQSSDVEVFKGYLNAAGTYAQQAIVADDSNYQNWIEAGRVFESVVPLQVKNAYEQAIGAYAQAVERNPTNPAIYLMLARLELANKNPTEAKKYIGGALQLKNNYAEAAFLLSQIQVQEGNLNEAIKSVQAAAQFSPNDQTIYFQLGLLKYNNKDYKGAIEAFTAAVNIDPQYSNARYFLGLSLSKIGNVDEAIKQFTIVQQYNPDNEEVALILKNLKAGKQPFADAEAPIDNKPEKRKTLPVKDDVKTTKKSASTL